VLLLIDVLHWALELKSRQIQHRIHPEFEITVVCDDQLNASQLASYDLVCVYFWQQIGLRPHLLEAFEACRDKLLIGICAHDLMEGAWRKPGLELMRRFARAVFVNNRLLLTEYEDKFDVPVFYTPNGVDTRFFRPRLLPRRQPGPMRVGWAGSLSNHGPEQRGFHDVIVPAAAAAGVELVTAVREDRWRSPRQMRDYYRGIDVYLCASRNEGTPNPCLEAAACGIPIVSAPVGCMPELIRDGQNGFLVNRNVDAFAAALRYLRDRPECRSQMGTTARRMVRSWDWRILVKNYEAMFRAVLAA
jgi:glycosyltransferase involved in cell wall biosynthesis